MWIFLAFLAVPLIEIGLFIQIGGWIGLWPTLGMVVLTAIIGTTLVRSQGRQAMNDLRRSMAELDNPSRPLAHGAMIIFAGALLLTPGFFTDAAGIALLIPQVRDALMRYISKRVEVQSFSMGGAQYRETRHPADPTIIEGECTEIDPENPPQKGDSGWTRH